MPKKIVARVESAQRCPIFKVGDKMVITLPEVTSSESDALCAIALADLLPWIIKATAGGSPGEELLMCRGCRGGKALAGFVLETTGDIVRDERMTAKLVSLRTIPLFSPLPDRQLEKVSAQFHEALFAPGEEILKAGEPGTALYVLVDGTVEVVKPSDEDAGHEKVLGVLNYGECFGEMSLLTGEPVSASIRAKSPVKTLEIRKAAFDDLLAKNPVLNSYFSKLLALRLRKTSKQFLEEFEKGVTGSLQMLAAPEVFQAITVTDRTGTLRIRDQKKTVDLYFVAGQIHHVESNLGLEPEEAVYDFMAWKTGTFRFEPGEREGFIRSFFKDTTGLLLEGMRRADEQAPAKPAEPPLSDV